MWSSGGWCGGKWVWSHGAVGGDGEAVGGRDGIVAGGSSAGVVTSCCAVVSGNGLVGM